MAIYHLHQQVISKGQGRSIVAAAAYRSGSVLNEKLVDNVTGIVSDMVHDYTKKENVVYNEIFAPSSAPSWVYDRETLWNKVTLAEKRKDAQYAKELDLALPVELDHEQSVELLRNFVDECFVQRGMVADVNIHWEEGNPHSHILLTTRNITENGFGLKNRQWNSKEFLLSMRELWAEKVNISLKKLGIDQKIDHRSFKDIGFGLKATIHEGIANKIDGYTERVELNRQIRNDNAKTIIDNPEIVVDTVSLKFNIFSRAEIAKEAFNILEASDDYPCEEYLQPILDKIFGLERLVRVGDGNLFISKEKHAIENSLFENIDRLKSSSVHKLDVSGMADIVSVNTDAIKFLSENSDIAILVGRAGTGKTSLISDLAGLYAKSGYNVYGGAVSGIATDNLAKRLPGQFRTIASWRALGEHTADFSFSNSNKNTKSIFILDEASMVDVADLKFLTDQAVSSGIKLIMVGDPDQLQPIGVGDGFRAIADKVGYFELEKIYRQNDRWQQDATAYLAKGNIKEAYDAYDKNGCINGSFLFREQARSSLVKDYVDYYINRNSGVDRNSSNNTGNLPASIILAYTREEVRLINNQVRESLKQAGCLIEIEGAKYRTDNGVLELCQGEQIVFTKNNSELGIYNGTSGIIEKVHSSGKDFHGTLTVRLQNEDNTYTNAKKPKTITIDTSIYNNFSYSYATTIHKSQGLTVGKTFLLCDKHINRNSFYVAASRHKDSLNIYWDKETFSDKDCVIRTFDRTHNDRNLAIDYDINESNVIYYEKALQYRKAIDTVINLYKQINEESLEGNAPFSTNEHYKDYIGKISERNTLAKEIYDNYKPHHVFLRQVGISKASIKRHAKIDYKKPFDSVDKDRVDLYLEHVKELALVSKQLSETQHGGNLSALNALSTANTSTTLNQHKYELRQKIQEDAFYLYHNKHATRKGVNESILEKHVERFVSEARAQYRMNTDEGYINKSSRRELTLAELYGVIINLSQKGKEKGKDNNIKNSECQNLAIEFSNQFEALSSQKDKISLEIENCNKQLALFDNKINDLLYIRAFTLEYLSKIYQNPQDALDKWDKLVGEHTLSNDNELRDNQLGNIEYSNIDKLKDIILKNPFILGKLQGKAILLFQNPARKKAMLFAQTLAKKLERDRHGDINRRNLILSKQKFLQEKNLEQLKKDLELVNKNLAWIPSNARVVKEIKNIAAFGVNHELQDKLQTSNRPGTINNIQLAKLAEQDKKNQSKQSNQENQIINHTVLDKEIKEAKNIIQLKNTEISKLHNINNSIESLCNKAYKENFEAVMSNWNKLVGKYGENKAINLAQDTPTLLGSLRGENRLFGIIEDKARRSSKESAITMIRDLPLYHENNLKIAALENDINLTTNQVKKIHVASKNKDTGPTTHTKTHISNLNLSKQQVESTVYKALYKFIKFTGGIEANKKHKDLHHDLTTLSAIISNYIRHSRSSVEEIQNNLPKYIDRCRLEEKIYSLEVDEKISNYLESRNNAANINIDFGAYSSMHNSASLYARLGARLSVERQIMPRESIINEELKKIYKSASAIAKQLAIQHIQENDKDHYKSFVSISRGILVEYMVNSGIKPDPILKDVITEVAKFQANTELSSNIVTKQIQEIASLSTKKDANLIDKNNHEFTNYAKSRLSYQIFEYLAEKYPHSNNYNNNNSNVNNLINEKIVSADLSIVLSTTNVQNIAKNAVYDSMPTLKEYTSEVAKIYIKEMSKNYDLS